MHKILLIKSKVQLKDNTDGFLLIINADSSKVLHFNTNLINYNDNELTQMKDRNGTVFITWLPTSILTKDQTDCFLSEELNLVKDNNSSSNTNLNNKYHNNNVKKINLIINGLFNNTLTYTSTILDGSWLQFDTNQIESIEFKPPNLNGWWDGSLKINLIGNNKNESPTLYLKDKLCPSTIFNQKKLNKSFDTFTNLNELYWGGTDIINCLIKSVNHMEKSKDNLNLWYLNKDYDQLTNNNNNNTMLLPKSLESTKENENVDNNNSSFNWENTKWSIMSTIATLTSSTTKNFNSLIKKHPIVKLINDNSDNVYIKKILKHPQVQKIQDDFDSAQIYLAKWSQGVKQEANRYQLTNNLDNFYLNSIINDLGLDLTKDIFFTQTEINTIIKDNKTNFKLNDQTWNDLFNDLGQLNITAREITGHIFHNGIDTVDTTIRQKIWPFLLGVYPWDSTQIERDEILRQYRIEYERLKNLNNYHDNTNNDVDPSEVEYWKDQIFRIEKDVLRNDRNLDIYKYNTDDAKPNVTETGNNDVEEIEEDESNEQWEIKNPHLLKLRQILITYNKYNNNLGYVQGMCDLLSPIYYILQDELMSFWCFVKFMERMERNFLRDQSGIRDQMFSLTELTQLLLPQLSNHLVKCDSSDLFFCFRMLIVWFKREFPINEICSIWEIIWTDYYNSQFQLFFMLAILQDNSQSIVKNLTSFDQVIKYFNDLHNTMNYKELITRSELLYLTFQKLMNIIDRKPNLIRTEQTPNVQNTTAKNESNKQADKGGDNPSHAISQSKHLRLLLSRDIVIQREPPRQADSIK